MLKISAIFARSRATRDCEVLIAAFDDYAPIHQAYLQLCDAQVGEDAREEYSEILVMRDNVPSVYHQFPATAQVELAAANRHLAEAELKLAQAEATHAAALKSAADVTAAERSRDAAADAVTHLREKAGSLAKSTPVAPPDQADADQQAEAAERSQLAALAAQAATQREQWFGVPMSYAGLNFQASAASFKELRQLEESGFERTHDAIIRVNQSTNPAFCPELGKFITVDSQLFRIEEMIKPRLNPEWRLGLKTAD